MAVFVSLDGIVVEVLDVFSSFNGDSEFLFEKNSKKAQKITSCAIL